MSFATYKSPHDETLSTPLISDDDTDTVTNTDTGICTPLSGGVTNNRSNINSNNNSKSNHLFHKSASMTLSSSSSAAYYSKLNIPNSTATGTTPTTTTRRTSSSNVHANAASNANANASASKFKTLQPFHDLHDEPNSQPQQYQPPNLTLETSTFSPSHTSLEAGLLRERHDEHRSILQNMSIIHSISNQINSIIHSQQEIIDDIEDDAYGVHDSVERGVGELENASGLMGKNQSGVEGIWRFFFGVIGVGGFFIALVIFLHSLR